MIITRRDVVWHNATVTRERREKLNHHKGALVWFTGLSGRRIGHMAHQFVQAGVIVLTAFISPFQSDRDHVRKIAGSDFHEVYCKCSLEVCEKRDVKGLYRKAKAGHIKEFTGITSPYEEPKEPDLILMTENDLDKSVNQLMVFLEPYLKL